MSTDIVPFEFGGEQVRPAMLNGDPALVLSDIAKILGYRSASDAGRILRDHHKGYAEVRTPGGTQKMLVVTERGFNRLVIKSNASNAEQVQDFITDEVMPQIARTGSYSPAPRELTRLELIDMARESELGRIAAVQRAELAETRSSLVQKVLDNVERKDGLVVRDWLKKYFPPRQEGRLWELFYSRRLLKDGRGLGGTDKKGRRKSSRDHQAVYTDGQTFFIRPPKEYQVGDGVTRYETRVRPGRAELELVAYCEKHGIAPLPEVSQALFEINDLSTVFDDLKGIAA